MQASEPDKDGPPVINLSTMTREQYKKVRIDLAELVCDYGEQNNIGGGVLLSTLCDLFVSLVLFNGLPLDALIENVTIVYNQKQAMGALKKAFREMQSVSAEKEESNGKPE